MALFWLMLWKTAIIQLKSLRIWTLNPAELLIFTLHRSLKGDAQFLEYLLKVFWFFLKWNRFLSWRTEMYFKAWLKEITANPWFSLRLCIYPAIFSPNLVGTKLQTDPHLTTSISALTDFMSSKKKPVQDVPSPSSWVWKNNHWLAISSPFSLLVM